MHIRVLPVDHLVLENHPEARKLRRDVGEVMVIFRPDGSIAGMLAPNHHFSREGYEFYDPTSILDLLQVAHACGIQETSTPTQECAPEGWILWRDLQPGMLAYDGHDQHILRFPEPFPHKESRYMGYGQPPQNSERIVDTVWLPSEKTIESLRSFADVKDPPLYLKLRREGLTQAKCHVIREMCKHGDFGVFSPTYIL